MLKLQARTWLPDFLFSSWRKTHTSQFAATDKALTVWYNRQHSETAFAPGLLSQSVSCVTCDRYMHNDRERSRVLTCDDGWRDRCHVNFVMAWFKWRSESTLVYTQGHCWTHIGSLSRNFHSSLMQYTVTTSDLSVTQHNNVLSACWGTNSRMKSWKHEQSKNTKCVTAAHCDH